MQKLTIRTQCKNNTTVVENEFIDTYMPKANGEYVKVYLYLLRHLNAHDTAITLSRMADELDNTERDILRALKHWEKKGLLLISYDDQGNICSIDIATISVHNVGATPDTKIPTPVAKASSEKTSNVTPKIANTKSRKEFKQLLFMIEQYLGKTLSKSDMDMISYFYDTLHFPIALIEFLVEYCAENCHYSMHYIQSVALAWADQDILTVEDAKAQICNFNKDYYTVLKAYGISGRNPVANERQFVDKWITQYGFSMELIIEACNRTIANIHQPSYEYTDSILNNWKSKDIHYLKDLDKLDQAYQNSKTSKATKKAEKTNIPKNTFNNFQQRTYDIESLEMQLLNAK
ncbi:MAG: DnaD domain protein [Eubacteriales bacterium]